MKLPSCDYHWTSLTINQHGSRNSMVPPCNQPILKPILTLVYVAILPKLNKYGLVANKSTWYIQVRKKVRIKFSYLFGILSIFTWIIFASQCVIYRLSSADIAIDINWRSRRILSLLEHQTNRIAVQRTFRAPNDASIITTIYVFRYMLSCS